MLGADKFNGQLLLGYRCEQGLPGEGGKVGGYADAAQPVVGCVCATKEPSICWCDGLVGDMSCGRLECV